MTRLNSKFIADEDIVAVSEWDFGAVDHASIRFAAKLKAQAESEQKAVQDAEHAKVDAIKQAGYTKGFEDGFAQGHAQATLEGQRQIAAFIETEGKQAAVHFAKLFGDAERQIADAEQVIAEGILKLACEVARQVVRRELTVNPDAVVPVVRECLSLLLTDGKAAVIRMNPADSISMADELQRQFSSLALTLVPDPHITRGGCLAEAFGTVVDGTVECRWQRSVATLGLDTPWEVTDDVS